MKNSRDQLPKKPYRVPKLSAYGNLAEMTKSRGKTGSMDGNMGLKTGG